MRDLESRVTTLEERLDHHAAMLADLRAIVLEIRDELRDFRQEVNRRFEQVDRRFEQVEHRFTWIVGFQLTTMLAIIAALLSALFLD